VNDAGDVFPVFGICLGFETIHILIANMTRENLLVPVQGQESSANTLELCPNAVANSVFFHRWNVSYF
jgi:anthranilate/para-aminobenzoate synthase component II